jgi:hypothetical protein
MVHLLQSWLMDLLLRGAIHLVVVTAVRSEISGATEEGVTAPQSKISLGMCIRFRPQSPHLPPSWLMAQSLPGAIQDAAVTALQSKISSGCDISDVQDGRAPAVANVLRIAT